MHPGRDAVFDRRIMNSINANLPVMNMPQVTSHQSEIQRAPMLHQAQNADMNRDKLDLQMRTAQEAEAAEGKTINPDDRKDEGRKGKKREKQEQENEGEEGKDTPPEVTVSMTDSGRLIDLEA